MRKFFSFFAITAVVLGMASCGDGNTPADPIDQQAFTFRLARLGDVAASVVITPTDPTTEYISGYVTKDKVWSDEVLANYVEEHFLKGYTYKELVDNFVIMSGERRVPAVDVEPTSECIFYACQVDTALNIVKLENMHVTTLEAGKLQGEFTIDAEGTKVRFSKGNLQRGYGKDGETNDYRFADNQWDALQEGNAQTVKQEEGWVDFYIWPKTIHYEYIDPGTNPITNGGNVANEWFTLSAEQWDYLLHSRDRASQLSGVGYVKGITGLILLPDNWEGSSLEEDNSFSNREWWEMELKGAVFLPVTGNSSSNLDVLFDPKQGYYWTSTLEKPSSDATTWKIDYLWFDDEKGIIMKQLWVGLKESYSIRLVQYVEK